MRRVYIPLFNYIQLFWTLSVLKKFSKFVKFWGHITFARRHFIESSFCQNVVLQKKNCRKPFDRIVESAKLHNAQRHFPETLFSRTLFSARRQAHWTKVYTGGLSSVRWNNFLLHTISPKWRSGKWCVGKMTFNLIYFRQFYYSNMTIRPIDIRRHDFSGKWCGPLNFMFDARRKRGYHQNNESYTLSK